jgi:Fur family transcriptional regulator, zinc uptake regulator
MSSHHPAPELTHHQQLVYDAVLKSKEPLSAYVLLDVLRGDGLRAPLQVYRALDKLVAHGLVHKLESVSAYVACQHRHDQSHAATVFMICESCGHVAECSNDCLTGDLQALAKGNSFSVSKTNIELRGLCGRC